MLDDIYEGECPLSFSSCRAAQNDGRRVIQVKRTPIKPRSSKIDKHADVQPTVGPFLSQKSI